MQINKKEKTKKWYTIKVQVNHERKVSERLKLDMKRENDEDIKVIIPTQTVVNIKEGKRNEREQLMYPGYIFVETLNVAELDAIVKATTGALNILKDNKKVPLVLRQSEVDRMIGDRNTAAKVIKNSLFQGERVLIKDGPFLNFKGVIESIDVDNDKVKVEVLIFGRKTSVDLSLCDVVKSNE